MYVRGYLQGSENGRVVTIGHVGVSMFIILISMYINLFAIFQQKLNILIKITSGPDRH
jgi:hypothetical protein